MRIAIGRDGVLISRKNIIQSRIKHKNRHCPGMPTVSNTSTFSNNQVSRNTTDESDPASE
jgi:hypothetical protein